MIEKMTFLKTLMLNFRSWGYENMNVSDVSVIHIFKCIGKLSYLESLYINLTKWGYMNNNIGKNSFIHLKENFT